MPTATAKRAEPANKANATVVLSELRDTHASLQACLSELEKILARPAFDAGSLTSVRLKLASIRLTRGPLIAKVADLLSDNVSDNEAEMLNELQSSHYRLLQTATMHTAKWTLDAIANDWATYRRDTRELVRKWMLKADREQRLVFPLVQRCVEHN